MKIESSYHSSGYSNSQDKPKKNVCWWRHDDDDVFLPQDSIKLSHSTQELQQLLQQKGPTPQKAKTKIQRQINLYKRNMFYLL